MTYPLSFTPHDEARLWGGERLGRTEDGQPVGERWLFSPVPGRETPVANGRFRGDTVDGFPLLIKLIDTAAPLSIQVHPDDAAARAAGLPCGKNEMWYILESAKEAEITLGLKEARGLEEVRRAVERQALEGLLRTFRTGRNDFFQVDAGQIHGIGAGQFLLEIQQPSDTTYRLYDYGRLDSRGEPRELHVDRALGVARLQPYAPEPIHTLHQEGHLQRRILVRTEDYTVERFTFLDDAHLHLDLTDGPPTMLIPLFSPALLSHHPHYTSTGTLVTQRTRLAPLSPCLLPGGLGPVELAAAKGSVVLGVRSGGS
ncbi:MAG: hypothetical protein CSA07_02910 [Bacteroidia bacterium]|nr:MAG: hypothetical protein CSA07_02910 [Bacteroidia bacterium]